MIIDMSSNIITNIIENSFLTSSINVESTLNFNKEVNSNICTLLVLNSILDLEDRENV